jgi:glycosyltransferase involved in cell wall biosynthesis
MSGERKPGYLRRRVVMLLKRSSGKGGLQLQARRVSLRMREMGAPVKLLTHSTHRLEEPSYWTRQLPTEYLIAPHQWSFAAKALGYLRAHRTEYDLVHVHGFGLDTFAAIAAALSTKKPLVVKPSTAGPGTKLDVYARLTSLLPWLFTPFWSRVNAWISISEQTRQDLLTMRVPPERILTIPNGVDTTEFAPLPARERRRLRRRTGVPPGAIVVCTIARLAPHKRVPLLTRAFLRVAEGDPRLHLWIVGEGPQLDELQGLAAASPAGDRVRFCGVLGDVEVRRALQCADLFALVSLWEGLSNALLEAMACEVCPIVTDVSGMTDVVRDGVRGVVVPPDDESAVESALRRLVASPRERRKMGHRAGRFIRKRYSLEKTARRLLRVYNACVRRIPLPRW